MSKPKVVIHMEGGLIQSITVSEEMKILVIDADAQEEPSVNNDVVMFPDGERTVFLYPAEVSIEEVISLFDTAGNALLIKWGLVEPAEEKD